METDVLIQMIAQLGFPAAIAVFFVWWTTTQLSKRMDSLAERIERNTETVAFLAVILAKTNGLDPDEMRKYVSPEKEKAS